MRRPDALTVLALWYLLLGAGFILGGISLQTAGALLWTGALEADMERPILLAVGLGVATLFLLSLGIAFLVTGRGLWKMRPWAKTPAMILAILTMIKFPIGTFAGAVTLWYLLKHREGVAVLEPR